MNKKEVNIVWLKRDLRTQDHLPLKMAEESSLPYLIIFLFEPSIISYPDTSLRHLQFQYHSLLQLNKKLSVFNKKIMMFFKTILLLVILSIVVSLSFYFSFITPLFSVIVALYSFYLKIKYYLFKYYLLFE